MTQDQLKFLDFTVRSQLLLLKEVKQLDHKDRWTDLFNTLVRETERKIIWYLENFFLLPTYNFNPLERSFNEENTPIRQEITNEVKRRFKEFRENENG